MDTFWGGFGDGGWCGGDGVVATGEERAAASGAEAVGGEGNRAQGSETDGAAKTEAVGGGDRGMGHGARLEEGEASSIGGSDDSTFQDMPKLSSRSRPTRLCQGTIFEMFEGERGRRRQSSEGTSAPTMEEEELGSEEDDDDADFDMEAKVLGEEEDEEEQEAEAEEQPTQVRRGAKRRRIHEGVGVAGWSILLSDGPLEGYRRRPAAMRHFHTIHGGQVHIDGLK